MNHELVSGLLSSFIDEEVSAEERLQIEAHVAECALCRTELDNLIVVKATVSVAPRLDMPPAATSRMMAAIEAELKTTSQARSSKKAWWLRLAPPPGSRSIPVLGTVAAVLVVAVGIGMMDRNNPEAEMAKNNPAPLAGSSPRALSESATSADQLASGAPEAVKESDSGDLGTGTQKSSPPAAEDAANRGPIYSDRAVSRAELDTFATTPQGNVAFAPLNGDQAANLEAALGAASQNNEILAKSIATAMAQRDDPRVLYAERVMFEDRPGWLVAIDWRYGEGRGRSVFVVGEQGTVLYP